MPQGFVFGPLVYAELFDVIACSSLGGDSYADDIELYIRTLSTSASTTV